MEKLLILNLEDNRNDAELNEETLSAEGLECEIFCVETREEFLAALEKGGFDIILADYSLPSFDGFSALDLVRERRPDVPFIFVTGTLGEEIVIEALKRGATDYVLKERLSRLAPAVGRALQERDERVERKQAEEALLVKNHVIESSINAIVVSDLEGYLTYVNPAFLALWGYEDDKDVLERSLVEFFQDPDETGNIVSLLREKGSWIGERIAKRKSGDIFEAQVSASLVRNEREQPICMMASFLDISERRQIEDRLRQAQKMEAMGTLAGGIAHDFNNILAAVIGYSEIALNTIASEDPIGQDLQQILNAGLRAKDLVKQILAFSRRSDQEKKPVRFALIIKEALKLLRASVPSTIEIQTMISPVAQMSTVLADPTELHQILMNLCTNSSYAMREKGGVLEVSLDSVDLDSEFVSLHPELEPGPYLRLSVSDTGDGMSAAVKQRIFEPYFTTKGQGEGTGLGLATVYGIVKSHHGAISVYSEPARGTVFHIFLPTIDDATTVGNEISIALPTGHGWVLLVDDEESMMNMERRILERLGYGVVAKSSSRDALAAFKMEPGKFDLIITDQTMPQMTGAELAREILAIRPDIPIILCTGFSDILDRDKAESIGICRFFMKPVMMADLAKAVSELLGKKD